MYTYICNAWLKVVNVAIIILACQSIEATARAHISLISSFWSEKWSG